MRLPIALSPVYGLGIALLSAGALVNNRAAAGDTPAVPTVGRDAQTLRAKVLVSSGPDVDEVIAFLRKIRDGRRQAKDRSADLLVRGRTSRVNESWKKDLGERTAEMLPPPDWCQFLLVHKGGKRRFDQEYIQTYAGAEQLATVYRLLDGEAFYKLDLNALEILRVDDEVATWHSLADAYFRYDQVHDGLNYRPVDAACQTHIDRITEGKDGKYWKSRILRCFEEDGLLGVENDRDPKQVAGETTHDRVAFWIDPRRGYHVVRSLVEHGEPGGSLHYRERTEVGLAEAEPGVFFTKRATTFVAETGTVARRDDRAGWLRTDMEVTSVKVGNFPYQERLFRLESLPVPKDVHVTDHRDQDKQPIFEPPLIDRLKVGAAAPAFSARALGGEPISLSSLRGKVVLLDFWATWCAPCRAETPHLKATHDAFGEDDRFVMIGLSVDDEAEAPKTYSAENGLKWLQCHLGEASKSSILRDFGVQGIPSIWLIGPDGKVVAKDLRGEGIKAAVAKALGRK